MIDNDNTKVTVILGQEETIQIAGLLRTAGILRIILGICFHSRGKPPANAGVKNSPASNNNNNNLVCYIF